MKTKKLVLSALVNSIALVSIASVITGCSDKEINPTPTELEIKSVMLSKATGYGDDWIYYSLEQGKEVQVSEEDHKGDSSWDIAFNRYNVRTNSGLSGDFNGGAYDCGKVDFASIKEVPTGMQLVVDTVYEIIESLSEMPPPTMLSTANPILSTAIAMGGAMPPVYVSNEHIYIIKTSKGKYAKLVFISFYDNSVPPKSGYVSFDYVIQADGTNKLE